MPAHPEAARFFLQDAPVLAVQVLQVLTVKFLLLELQLLAKPEDRPIPVLVPSPFSTICSGLSPLAFTGLVSVLSGLCRALCCGQLGV